MPTISFMPDRLNAEPVVYRGFTVPELGLAAIIGTVSGGVLTLPLLPFIGWVMLPTGMLLMPLALVFLGGGWLSRVKRGKPANFIWQRLGEKLRRQGLGDPRLIIDSRGWSLKRSRMAGRRSI